MAKRLPCSVELRFADHVGVVRVITGVAMATPAPFVLLPDVVLAQRRASDHREDSFDCLARIV